MVGRRGIGDMEKLNFASISDESASYGIFIYGAGNVNTLANVVGGSEQ
jgi:hypothetical protein